MTLADGSYWIYTYDRLGQVVSGKRYWQDGTPVAGQQFEYGFDDIGNRKTAATGGDASGTGLRVASYGANLLNQYTNRTVPGTVDILGVANPTAAVAVNGNTAYRKGDYFWQALSVGNSSAAQYPLVTTISQYGAKATNTGNVYLPQTPEVFTHDADGNLTQDGRWDYTWDGENRLIAMQTRSTVLASGVPEQRLDFAYDPQSRRISKTVSNKVSGAWSRIVAQRFLYDGWNLLAILNSQSSIVQSFAWGLDLSGSLQGAGGVGGLLWVSDASTINGQPSAHAACYDGNGNAAALVNFADGSLSARYEYGPFGEPIRQTGPMAEASPFRFSTKFTDDESGHLYYGYRYYSPTVGRWVSRDPIEELGGVNLLSFLTSNPLNLFDPRGACDYGLWCGIRPPSSWNPPDPPSDPVRAQAWWMFWHLFFGDLNGQYHLSPEVIEAAKQRISRDDIRVELRKVAQCGSPGSAVVRFPLVKDFEIEDNQDPTDGVHIGKWFLEEEVNASWNCGAAKTVNGKCCCECTAAVSVKAHIYKVYTFSPLPQFNPANRTIIIQIMNYLAFWNQMIWRQHLWLSNVGPAYPVSEDFEFGEAMNFRKCVLGGSSSLPDMEP